MVGSTQKPERVEIADVQGAVSRHDFPTEPDALAGRIEERHGDARVVEVVRRLPGRRYESPAELLDAVRDLDASARDVPSEAIRHQSSPAGG